MKGQSISRVLDVATENEKAEIMKALEAFYDRLDILTSRYGEDEVVAAIDEELPGLITPSGERFGKVTERITARNIGSIAGRKATGMAKTPLKFVKKKLAKLLGFGGAMAAGGLGSAIATAGSKGWDQDVDISDITTDKYLNVGGDVLSQTNALLTQIAQLLSGDGTLSKQLDDLDVSIDSATAADTGMSTAQVDAAQEAGVSLSKRQPKGEKGKKPGRKPQSPKPEKK